MKKRLSLLLVLCLACFCLAAAAEAPLAAPSGLECYWNDGEFEPGPHYDGVLWASNEVGATHAYVLLEDGTAEIVDMTYYGYWIPETVDGLPVTAGWIPPRSWKSRPGSRRSAKTCFAGPVTTCSQAWIRRIRTSRWKTACCTICGTAV